MKQEYGEISIFDIGKEEKRIRKPIRLIEFFAGYGSQALALKYLGVPFEHHKISEWAVPSIKAYKDLHFEDDKNDYSADMTIDEIKAYLCGRISQNYNVPMSEKQIKAMKEETARGIYSDMVAEHNLGSICLVHGSDLEIEDTEKYEYILTYSFPCQDLTNSGKRAGMEKGSGTRSGMLWEVERILNELNECGREHLPQTLIMENVPAVCGSGNIKVFAEWLDALEKLGYGNYYKILNATDYGIPQNRERCFMVSLLGGDMYEFPVPIGCKIKLGDVLERNIPEKYYLSDKAVESFIASTERQQAKGNGFKFEAVGGGGYGE